MADQTPVSPVLEALERFRGQLEAKDAAAVNRLVRSYHRSYKRLEGLLDSLLLQIGDTPPTRGQLVRMARYKSLLEQVAQELAGLRALTADEVDTAGRLGIELGKRQAADLIGITLGDASIGVRFDRLPKEAVESLLGFLDPAGPLYERLRLLAPTTTGLVADAMIEGITLGYNPRKIAATLAKAFGQGLTDALRFVRTAQLWAYREASRATYVANQDLLDGWVWVCDFGPRTCGSCFAMHGTVHPVTEPLNDHHNGRCAAAPLVKGFENPVTESGEDWFRRQPEEFQKGVLGRQYWEAWQGGAYEFSELTDIHRDDVYGDMRVTAPLWKLLGAEPPARM